MLSISVLMVTSVVPTRPSARAVVGAAPIASASASPVPTTSALVPLKFLVMSIIVPFYSSRTVSVMVGRKRRGCAFSQQAAGLVFCLRNPHLDARGIAMGVVGLGVERLDLDVRLAFFDVACGAGLNGLAGLDHA